MESFNDQQLIRLVKEATLFGVDEKFKPIYQDVSKLLGKQALSNKERNTLLTFLTDYSHIGRQLSGSEVRKRILDWIGFKDTHRQHSYGSISYFDKTEMIAVYNFLKEKLGK